MADIVLYDRVGDPVTYEGIETITTDTPDAEKGATFTYGVAVENAEYEPNFANGNQKVILEKGQLLKEFTLKKPETLLPEYIKKGVEVAGVLGGFAGDETEKTVELNMADGKQVIEADEDTVMKRVTVNKPTTMVPENIKKDVEIGGIVGTFTGNGVEKTVELNMADGDQEIETDNDTVLNKVIVKKPSTLLPENIVKGINIGGIIGEFETTGEKLYSTEDPEWIDKVVFWDCDGSIVSMFTVEEAKTLFELPTPPIHEGLTFQGWNFSLEEIQATTDVLDVGAIYVPSDGKTHVKIEVTSTTASNRTVPTYFSQTVSNGVTIDWGDGTVETIEGTGVVTISHVYATTGEYEVTYDVADGCEMTMGGESSSYRFIWKNNTSVKVKEIYIGERVVGIGNYAFYSSTAQNIQLLTIPNGVKTIGNYTFKSLYNLKCVLIPKTVESIGQYSFGYMCYYTGEEAVLSLPNSVLTIYGYLVECSTILRVILPNELESISNSMFYNAYALRKVILKDKITSIGTNAFEYCQNLKTLELPNNVKTISSYAFQESGIESLVIPEGVTMIDDYTFRYAYSLRELILPTTLIAINQYAFNNCRSLRRIIIPENVETVGTSWLEYCTAMQSVVISGNKITTANNMTYTKNSVREVVFLQAVPPTAASNLAMTFLGEIYVPDEAVDAYAALISSSSLKCRIRPLREYIGEKYWE